MKKLLLAASLLLSCYSFAQTTIWTEDFENSCSANCVANGMNTGNGPWTLTENSPTTDGCGFTNTPNVFFVSCAENGNAAGMCGTGCGNDESLHVGAGTIGDLGAAYDAGGWCELGFGGFGDGTTTDARIESPAIDLTGETNPTVNFNYMEAGDGANDDASLWYYNGSSWALLDALAKTTPCGVQGTWTAFSIALPASANNNPNVKIGFVWVNNDDGAGSDPSFAVDDITISVPGGGSNTITTGTGLVPTSWCEGSIITIQVDFTSTGTFSAGNVYTAQLSDGAGSFASPLDIGTLNSTANSGMITAIIPGSVVAGTGYRIRVTSSNPATIGSENGSDLVINPLPTVTQQPFANICEGASPLTLTGGSPGGGSYSGTGVGGGDFDPSIAGVGSTDITYIYTDGNGCTNSVVEPILVIAAPTVTQQSFMDICEDASPLTLTGGSPAGGTYSGTGVSGGSFDPGTAGQGTTIITYLYTDGNGCSNSVDQPIIVIALPTVTQQSFTDICESSSPVNLIGGSPAGGTYSGTGVSAGTFDPSVPGQGTTNITYTYTDGNGCSGSVIESITVIPSPTVSLSHFGDVCVSDAFFTLTGGSPAGGTYTGPGVTGGVFDPATAGVGTHTLTYSYTDGNGCTGEAFETIYVGDCSGLGELGPDGLLLYPNPVSGSFTLVSEQQIERVEILDMSGRVIKSFNEQQASYNISEVPSGVYFVTIYTSELTGQLRIVVE